jgi:hypothetical protein
MTTQKLVLGGVIPAVLAAVALATVPLAAQTAGLSSKSTVASKAGSTPWTPPRTPWGDPDLQGVWTSDSAIGIPVERPAQFAGRAELSEEEYKQRLERDARTRTAAENAIGSFRGDSAWLNKSFRQTSLIVEPADGEIPPLTPRAEARKASRDQGTFGDGPFDTPEDFTLYDRCITRGIVGSVLPVIYGNGNRILQTPGQVVITYEMIHDTRIIPLDGRPHLGRNIGQYLGDSRGHWEGNTLVVENTNFVKDIAMNGINFALLTDQLRIVERFARIAPDKLSYDATIEDPGTWARPWTMHVTYPLDPTYELFEYACHEANYGMADILKGARMEEQRKAGKK